MLLTHKHIDHIGNAWRIQRESGAEVYIHDCERKSLTEVDPSGKRFVEMVQRKIESWGVPSELLQKSQGTKMPQWQLEPCEVLALPEQFSIELDGRVATMEVIETPGHSMGSVCFRLGDCLFSGDHILERLSLIHI